MKTLTQITNIIATQLGAIAREVSEDYKIIVCPERIFVDDYQAQRDEAYENTNADEIPSLNGEEPNFTYYSKTIFFVIKVGSGQRNMAVANSNVTIQALSEEDDFVVAREILDRFVATYNFKYIDGIAQAYFTPDMSSSQDSVYTGFRALLSCRGFVRVPEQGFMFINNIFVNFVQDGVAYENYRLPFLSCSYSYVAQPDPQAFAGYGGSTKALNRQSTETITLTTYLKYNSGDDLQEIENAFTKAILRAKENMNGKFHIVMKTTDNEISITDDYFVLTSAAYGQELADLATWNLTFTAAKEEED